jgi:hypothetical protein
VVAGRPRASAPVITDLAPSFSNGTAITYTGWSNGESWPSAIFEWLSRAETAAVLGTCQEAGGQA